MRFNSKHYFSIIWIVCGLCLQLTAAVPHPQQPDPTSKQHYKITVQNSAQQPQKGMVLRILGEKDEFISNSNGLFDFEAECSEETRRTGMLYFPENLSKSVYSFQLHTITSDTIFIIDKEEDILSFKQNNMTFPIQGTVKNQSGKPIAKALVSIQGTGRKTQTDASGRFAISADYNHPIVIRANGMMNQTLNIQYFLSNPEIEKAIYMQPQNTYQVYTTVEKMPEFPGGMKAFQQYVRKNLPQQNVKEKGVVIIQFIVEKDGSISSPTIARGFKADLDTLSLNLVSNMPKWIPGEEDNGNKVRCKYSVPIQFKPKEPETPKRTAPAKPIIAPAKMVQDTLAQDTLANDTLVQAKTMNTVKPIPTDSLTTAPVKEESIKEETVPADSLSTQPLEQPETTKESELTDSITTMPLKDKKKQEVNLSLSNDSVPPL